MYQQNQQLHNMIMPVIQAMGYEMLGIEYFPKGKKSLLRIYIDKPDGISLDDCEQVSQQVTGILDVNDPIRGSYVLEVSSPGMDRPLFSLEQFRRHIGSVVRVSMARKIEGRKNITGVIHAVKDNSVEIQENGHILVILESLIDKARLVPNMSEF